MSHEYLSDEQIAGYGRFPDELSAGDLERFFRLTPHALDLAADRGTPSARPGWAVQWGTVRRPRTSPSTPHSSPVREAADLRGLRPGGPADRQGRVPDVRDRAPAPRPQAPGRLRPRGGPAGSFPGPGRCRARSGSPPGNGCSPPWNRTPNRPGIWPRCPGR
ncbi:DUF4158 domain-containing protein [Nocardiopsis lambiniae]|uniref:DUF4158 domain-containing protein n=1 Tax=Nocardiopsis lambiniae TaxID=3075539 RepID=UPI0037CCBD31